MAALLCTQANCKRARHVVLIGFCLLLYQIVNIEHHISSTLHKNILLLNVTSFQNSVAGYKMQAAVVQFLQHAG
jgi:hypothetical protein